jgi:hypothetical protein
MRGVKAVAAVVALVAWSALALQYILLVKPMGFGLAAWRFVGFFTILTNIGVALIATGIALGREGGLTDARARLMGLTSIVTVGITYSLLLRATWHPQGWQKVVDVMLHDATPILFLGLWMLMPHSKLGWRDLKWALAPPLLYFIYAMGRGAMDGWYAYYFLNPATQSLGQLAVSVAGMLAIIAVVAVVAISVDKRLGRRDRSHQ